MKKFLFFILTLPFLGLAQTVPQGINYQAVARDASGAVLVNQSLIVQFSVISDVTTSTVSWQETHTATTNDHGLFTAIIGQGTATSIGNSATFDAINWGASNHLLKVEVDYGNGIFVDMGTTAFLSVPYALSSGSSANALWQDNGGYITNIGGGEVRIDGFSHNIGDGGIFGVNTDLHGHMVNLGDGFMGVNTAMGGFMTIIRGGDTRIESPLEVWNNAQFDQNVNISGDVSGSNAPVNADHLTRKDYVDAADAAILDSVSALDSTMIANALWQDNGGYITNIGGGDVRIDGFSHNIGDGGFMGVNTELHGDRVNLGDGIFGVNTEMGGHMVNLGDGFMGVNTEMGGFRTIIRGGDTRIESPLEVWNDAQFDQNVNISGDLYAAGQLLSSDRRFKRDIVTVKNALSKVLQLRGVNYYWKQQEFPNRNFDEKLELGLIAQEVELIIPEIVAEAEDGYKAVEYQKLVALLIEAIKEQQTIIEGQKTEMADMRVELDSRLKALEDILTTTTLNTK